MNSKWMWAVVIIAALVLALSHYAVWEWRGAVDDRRLAEAPATVETHNHETPPQTVTGTVAAKDSTKPVVQKRPPFKSNEHASFLNKDSLIQSLGERLNREMDVNDYLTARILSLERPDTLEVDSTATVPPASFAVIHNPQSFSDRWWYWLQLSGYSQTDTTITRTVLGSDEWHWVSFFVGTTSMAIVFAIILMLIG